MNSEASPGASLFMVDVSDGMLELVQQRFTNGSNSFIMKPGNKFYLNKEP